MKLCTFEVATHLGRHRRLGAAKDGCTIDLNFATAWYMAQTGEPAPQQLADALVPPDIESYLRAGLRATHSAEELFLGAGPRPADWWKKEPAPRGPNDETLVYLPGQARLLAPLAGYAGPDEDIPAPAGGLACEARLFPVAGLPRNDIPGLRDELRGIAGFTILADFGGRAAMGPYITTLDKIGDPEAIEIVARVNGAEQSRGKTVRAALKRGDTLELEAELIGVLRSRIV